MDAQLHDRLSILEVAGEITPEIKEYILHTLLEFETDHNVTLTEENASQLVSHFAMSCARIARGEQHTEIPDSIREVVDLNPEMKTIAQTLFAPLQKNIEMSEIAYMTTHLCLLLQGVE